MIQMKALIIKELKEVARDRRALIAALLIAFMAPVMIFAISKLQIEKATEKPPIYVTFVGAEHAPKLVQQLNDDNIVSFIEVPKREASIWKKRNITLIFPNSFDDDMRNGRPIDVIFRADYNDKAMSLPIFRIKSTINRYSLSIGAKRIIVRGIDPLLLKAINFIEEDTALPGSNAWFITMLLGMYLLMAAFLSGLSIAIDSSAGERERKVLEMLLCQPIKTYKIVLAKLLSASLVAALGVLLTLLLTTIALKFVDLSKISATFNLDLLSIISLLVLLLPICFFSSSLQLFFAFQARSFKEAQSTVTMIIMLPAFIPMALSFVDDRPEWLNWLPISGQALLMEDIFKGTSVGLGALFFTGLVTLIMTSILVQAISMKLKSEKVILALS